MSNAKRRPINVLKNVLKLTLSIQLSLFVGCALANLARGEWLYPESYADLIIEYAEECMGRPYKLGGNGDKVFDCSGYINWLFRRAGISIPRNSRAQARYWRGEDIYRISDLQKGDLIFFRGSSGDINHVGLVVSTEGGVVVFIHCSANHGCVAKDKLSGRWARKFVKAKRLFETIDSKGAAHVGTNTYAPRGYSQAPEKASTYEDSPESISLDALTSNVAETRSETKGNIPGKYPEASERLLTYADLVRLARLNKWELRVMRNEIFARHGYQFHINLRVIRYFKEQDWYNEIPGKAIDSEYIYMYCMSEIERRNIELIKSYE